MPLTVAFQMDPVEGLDITADSTFALALEAQERGHRLYHYLPGALSARTRPDGRPRVVARARPLEVRRQAGNHATLGAEERLDLAADVDVVMMRQDPPFDMAYITATHLLEMVEPQTLVVNRPGSVRNAPEKLFALAFPQFVPPTLISADPKAIADFRAEHGDIIVKPLYGNGGAGVFHLRPDDTNLNSLLEMFAANAREPVMIQRYLPAVRQGDKRIILIDGEVAGALNRIPRAGETRSNLHVGGQAAKSTLTAREHEICAALRPVLKAQGLLFVGIDVIGEALTEINVTSPTGLQEIDRFDGANLPGLIWNAIETHATALGPV